MASPRSQRRTFASGWIAEQFELVEAILDNLDVPDASIDAAWAREAEDRLAAFRRGEIPAVPLS